MAAGALAAGCALTPRSASAWGLFGVDIGRLEDEASRLYAFLSETVDHIKAMDFESAYQNSQQVGDLVAAMEEELGSGLWPILEYFPIVGTDVAAARKLVSCMSRIASEALLPLAEAMRGVTLSGLISRTGSSGAQVDVPTVRTVGNAVADALPAVSEAAELLESIGEPRNEQLRAVVESARGQVVPVAHLLEKAADLIKVLPAILGDEGPRVYAVLAQNNVEVRATGGLPGQACRVVADRGNISVGEVDDIYSMMGVWWGSPVFERTSDDLELYYPTVAESPANTNCNPDFPRDCEIWGKMWRWKNGEELDGVLAIDPPTLQMVLGLTRGAELPDGRVIDGTNATRLLSHDTYHENLRDGYAQDDAFTAAAAAALECILDNLGQMSLPGLLDVVCRSRDEGRLLAWFADEREQWLVEDHGASGALVTDAQKPPVLGIYLNNASWSKIEWWLDEDIWLGEPVANPDGSSTYECRLTLSNIATWDELKRSAIDEGITGGNVEKRSIDDILDGLLLYAPAGGRIEILSAENCDPFQEVQHKGLQVFYTLAHNCIGEPAVVDLLVTTSPLAKAPLKVRATPTVQDYRG